MRRLAVFPGTFNPPTKAHLALIEAAATHADHVVAVLPRTFPHKSYHGATLEQRVHMLESLRPNVPFSVEVTTGGLFIEIAHELRSTHGPDTDLWFLCGRDAAERIIGWDYGNPDAIHYMLQEFGLLVANRQGDFEPPEELAHRIESIPVPPHIDDISASTIRKNIETGEPWEHLAPPELAGLIGKFYSR